MLDILVLDVGAFYTDGEIGDRGNKGDNFWVKTSLTPRHVHTVHDDRY